MAAEVPAYVQYEPTVVNGVHVVGGSNWDLSRSAVETPIQLAAPVQAVSGASSASGPVATTSPEIKKSMKKKRVIYKKSSSSKHKKQLLRKTKCPCAIFDK